MQNSLKELLQILQDSTIEDTDIVSASLKVKFSRIGRSLNMIIKISAWRIYLISFPALRQSIRN